MIVRSALCGRRDRQDPTHSANAQHSSRTNYRPIPKPKVYYFFSLNLIHNFLIGPLLLRIVAPCSLHAWGEQSSIKKHNRTYHPAHRVEEGAYTHADATVVAATVAGKGSSRQPCHARRPAMRASILERIAIKPRWRILRMAGGDSLCFGIDRATNRTGEIPKEKIPLIRVARRMGLAGARIHLFRKTISTNRARHSFGDDIFFPVRIADT